MLVTEGYNVVFVREHCNLLDSSCMNVGLSRTGVYTFWGVYKGQSRVCSKHLLCSCCVVYYNMLAITSKDNPYSWEDQVRKVCLAYNTSPQSTTGYTPFFLVFGPQARLPVDIMHGTNKPLETTHGEFATRLKMTW